jgi:hypothetical protein
VPSGDTVKVDAPTAPKTARTAEVFDLTTPEQHAAAVRKNPQALTFLGKTIASLGNPADVSF